MMEQDDKGEEEEEEGNTLVQSLLQAQGLSLLLDDAKHGITVLQAHQRQRETWDCGIACLQMILNLTHHGDTEEVFSYHRILDAIGNSTQSIWTADLVWCLYQHYRKNANNNNQQNPLKSCWFVTKSLWPNPVWEQLDYYQQAYTEDCQRVTCRVDEMMRMQQQQQQLQSDSFVTLWQVNTLSVNIIKQLIQREDCLAMALVDHNLLLLSAENHPQQHPTTEHSYVGHYILLTGIVPNDDDQTNKNMLVVHNPAMDEAPCYISLDTFERAWRAQGTDEDIVFVFFHQHQLHNNSE